MSVNRIDATLTDDQRDRANAALVVLAEVPPFPGSVPDMEIHPDKVLFIILLAVIITTSGALP